MPDKMPRLLKVLTAVWIFFGFIVASGSSYAGGEASRESDADRVTHSNTSDYASVSKNGDVAVATVNPLATQAAMDIVAKGGNAVDAAIAAALTLGVVDSHNSGIGGGCFVLVRLANGEIFALDGREQAPLAASRDMYIVDGELQNNLSKTGALAAGIPGSVAALFELQKKGGKRTLADALSAGIYHAENGFEIDTILAARLERTKESIQRFPATAAIYLNAKGEPFKAGERLVQKDLAKSYKAIARQGPEWFYQGGFAAKTAAWMKQNGGIITEQDFKSYTTVKRSAVKSQYLGFDIYGFPPPSSGGVHVAQILNIVSQFDFAKLSDVQRYHVLGESMQLAFADRAYWLGDSDFVPVPKGLSDKSYAAKLAEKIRLDKTLNNVKHGTPPNATEEIFNKHTTHIAAADKAGNWVAITTTLNTSFGSKVVIPGTGILLNNQMDDFASQPGVPNAFGLVGAEANSIAPRKRPLSSMSPTLVLKDDQPIMTVGAAGGPTIITQVVQALIYKLALGYDIESAVAAPRVHHQWRPGMMFVDSQIPEADIKALEALGHQLKTAGNFGATQAIALQHGKLVPVTEPRVIKRNKVVD